MVLKALLFDLDGVITDTAEYHYQAWKKLASSINIEVDYKLNEQLKGKSRMASLEIILASVGQQDKYSDSEKEALATQKNEDYQVAIKQITPEDIFPSIERLLDDARDGDLKLVLCSSSQNGPVILEQLQLTDHFDDVVNPNTLEKGKPDPEIFLTAAKLAGVEPTECIAFEDAVAGVEAINAARGMLSIGVGNPEILITADVIVDDTSVLNLEFLQEIYKHQFKGN